METPLNPVILHGNPIRISDLTWESNFYEKYHIFPSQEITFLTKNKFEIMICFDSKNLNL